VKLIAATSLVVAAAVAASTFSGHRTIEDLGRRDAAMRRQHGELAIARESDLLAQKVAATVAIPLGNNTFSDVQLLLDEAKRDAERRGDRRIQWMVVTDVARQVVAHVGATPNAARLTEVAGLVGEVPPGEVVRKRVGSDWVYGAAIAIGKSVIGRVHMGVSTAALDAELAASIREVEDRARRSTHMVWLIAGIILFAGIVLAALQGIGIGRPLRLIAYQAERLADGHFDERVPENRRDEIGVLAQSFNRMAGDLGALVLERQQMAVLERELDLARSVQQSMLPPAVLGRHGHLKIVGHCSPASSCGGDWWTFRGLKGGQLLIVVGDATGHGLHSALVASTARGAVEALAEVDERLLTPENVLKSIDSAIRNVGDHRVLMTCFVAVFDPDSARLSYANAGQNFPYVIRMGPGRVLEDADTLTDAGNPLGDRNRIPEFRREGSVKLNPGDLFVCFTDGLVQRQSRSGKLFGERRLRSMLQGSVVGADGTSLVALRDKVLSALDAFAEGTIADDDITFVLCQFDPPGARSERRRVG
jgi:serine phosphatase RsbU (regulator of sigma subunit)